MKHLKKILTAVTLVAAASGASAVPTIQFDLNASSFNPGSGYSAGTNLITEVLGNLSKLGVDFSADGTARTFGLTAGNTSTPYKFGDITLQDGLVGLITGPVCRRGSCTHLVDETDNLDLTATFSFTNPSGVGSQTVTALGTATIGVIGDRAVDFAIDWTDLPVSFGNGGQFIIHMDDVSFTSDGQTKAQNYSIELVTAPIPEPETYALMMAGLGLVGFMARRRKQA
jgi:hypothetical protein